MKKNRSGLSELSESSESSGSVNRSFWLGKLFSLAGIAPFGVYVFLHLYGNLGSLSGAESFNRHLASSRSLPLIVPLTVLVIWIPILFHGFYGLFSISKARPNLTKFPFFGNLKYILQRLSGVGLLLFIPAHIFKTRFEPFFSGHPLDYNHMVEGLHEPLTLTIYVLGVLGVAFHLANGIWQFSIGWGIAISERGMKRMQNLSYGIFGILLAMGVAAIWGFVRSS